MPTLTKKELLSLIKKGETTTLEFKIAPPRPAELAERLCGMANGQGGLIVIGVRDTTLEIVGIKDANAAVDTVLRATRLIQPMLVLDPPEPEIYLQEDGRKLLVATVLPSSGPLYQAGGVCWVRRGTNTFRLSVLEMIELVNDRGLVKWELQPAGNGTASLDDLDREKIQAYLNQRRQTRNRQDQDSRFEDLEQVLLGMKCIVKDKNGELRPTNAGILFFGKDPQFYLPQSEVVCVLYRDESGIGGYADRWIIGGTLAQLIDETEAFLNRYVPVGAKIEGWKRIDLPEYPLEALREAVVNAVVHRDYSREGESIRIFYYRDRVEIHSPGLLLPGITIEQMEQGEVISKLRNPVLANLLRDIPGYMERIGSGIRLMLAETRRMGLPVPQFREIGEFVVTFHKVAQLNSATLPPPDKSLPNPKVPTEAEAGITAPELNQPVYPTGETKRKVTEDKETGRKIGPLDPEARLQVAMRFVRENGYITNRQLRDLTGVSEQTAMRDLEGLADDGALVRVGKTRARRYKLP